MAKRRLKTVGFKSLDDKLKKLGDAVDGEDMRSILFDAAKVIAKKISAEAPVGTETRGPRPGEKFGRKPGTLRDSWVPVKLKNRKGMPIAAGVYVRERAFYWRFINYGTWRIMPNPFFDRGLAQGRRQVRPIIRKGVESVIRANSGGGLDE